MKKSYLPWVDLTRIIAVFLVTLTHSALPIVYNYDSLPRTQWLIGNMYNTLTRACVPLFFMLSGYLLLGKNEKLKDFLFVRIPKILIPLVAWSAFYVIWNAYYEKSAQFSFSAIYKAFFTPAYYHFWFMFALLGNYLFIPILKVFSDNSTRTLQYYYLAIWFLAVSIVSFFEEITGLTSSIDLLMISGYVGYLFLGYLLGNMVLTQKHLIYSAVVVLISLGITYFGTGFASGFQGRYVGYFYHYLSPNIISLSIASYILIKGIAERSSILNDPRLEKPLRIFGSASLGIYLIHPVFLYLLQEGRMGFQLSALTGHPIFGVLETAVVTFSFSFVFIFFILKVPIVNRLVS